MFCAGLSLSIMMLSARNALGKNSIHFRTACLKDKECLFKTIIRKLNEASQLGTFSWVEVPKTMKLESLLLNLLSRESVALVSDCLSAQREKNKFSKEREDLFLKKNSRRSHQEESFVSIDDPGALCGSPSKGDSWPMKWLKSFCGRECGRPSREYVPFWIASVVWSGSREYTCLSEPWLPKRDSPGVSPNC